MPLQVLVIAWFLYQKLECMKICVKEYTVNFIISIITHNSFHGMPTMQDFRMILFLKRNFTSNFQPPSEVHCLFVSAFLAQFFLIFSTCLLSLLLWFYSALFGGEFLFVCLFPVWGDMFLPCWKVFVS